MEPIPVGTTVNYTGSHKHGRYVIAAHQDPHDVFPEPLWEHVAGRHPDGVCYEIWPEGMERTWRNRDHMVYRVKRASLEVAQ